MYTVKEQYSATETYYEEEPYREIIQVPLAYEVVDTDSKGWSKEYGFREYMIAVKNTDTEPGYFTLNVRFDKPGTTEEVKKHHTRLINPGYTEYLWCRVDFWTSSFTHSVAASEKNIEKISHHSVPKQRTVTKYRDVTKYKYISTFEYLMQE